MIGKCALCGKETEMTFEHIPPRLSFNSIPSKAVNGEDLLCALNRDERNPWEISDLQYSNQQRGMGRWSLCTDCNTKTGSWYGNSYIDFSHRIHNLLVNSEVNAGEFLHFEMRDVFPLRIIKQILSMFCSINQQQYEDIRIKRLAVFVLNRELKGLDCRQYRVFIYIANNFLKKYCPFSVLLRYNKTKEGIVTDAISEIFAYPIGIVVCFDPKPDFSHEGADITSFGDIEYDQKCSVELRLPVLESYNLLPCDYRSKEELSLCKAKNDDD